MKKDIDTEWFLEKIRAHPFNAGEKWGRSFGTARQLAALMTNQVGEQMDIASLTRMLKGERNMSLSEAVQISTILEVPLEEIAERALGTKLKKRR